MIVFQHEVCDQFEVKQVPTMITTYGSKMFIQKLKVQSLYSIQNCLQSSLEIYHQNYPIQKASMNLKYNLILENSSKAVLLFIKGSAFEPRCKFTRELIQLLKNENIKFDFVNILEQGEFKEWIKVFSGQQTFPQIFVNKKLIGGLDTVKDMLQTQEFQKLLPEESFITNEKTLNTILSKYSNEVLVFLNGSILDGSLSASEKQLIQLMKSMNIRYSFGDLKNEEKFRKYLHEKFSEEGPIVFIGQQFVRNDQLCETNLVQKIPLQAFKNSNLEKIQLLVSKIPLVGFITNDEKFQIPCDQLVEFLLQNALNSRIINADQPNINEALKQYLNTTTTMTYPIIFLQGKLFNQSLEVLKSLDVLK